MGHRTAFKIGLGVVAISVFIGTLIGALAAYYGGKIDEILMRIVDVFMAVPFLIAAMVLTALLGKGIGPDHHCADDFRLDGLCTGGSQ